jgi:hypothetical protein
MIHIKPGDIDPDSFPGAAETTKSGNFEDDRPVPGFRYIDGGEVHAKQRLGLVCEFDLLRRRLVGGVAPAALDSRVPGIAPWDSKGV